MRGIHSYKRATAILACAAAILISRGSGRGSGTAHRFSDIPLGFEKNEGQFPAETRFVTRTGRFALILTDGAAIVKIGAAPREALKPRAHPARNGGAYSAEVRFAGSAKRDPRGEERLPGVANYLIGNDRSRWRTGVPEYARVRYPAIYPGIDLVYRVDAHTLEYDLVVAPHARTEDIRLQVAGAGARLNQNGDLALEIGSETLVQRRPVAYQERNGKRQWVEAHYAMERSGGEVAIRLGEYDRSRPLVIDPVLDYGVFVGGSGVEGANSLAVDATGNAYITGQTTSADFGRGGPVFGGLDGPSDAFVAKVNASGTALVYTTYLGGSGADQGTALAVSPSGVVYLCGATSSPDFPLAGATRFPYGGGIEDGFFAILNSSGASLLESTYYGGSGDDFANAIAVDGNFNSFVTGASNSASLEGVTSSSPQNRNAGGYDTFVAKFSTSGALLFATFYGGTGDDYAYGVACDSNGNAFVTGSTTSPALPGASGNTAAGNASYLFEISSSGSVFGTSQIFGGSGDQIPFGVSIDTGGTVWVVGATSSKDYPITSGAVQKTLAGDYDTFITAFSTKTTGAILGLAVPTGLPISYSSYLGGSGRDLAYSVATGQNGTVYVAGYTDSSPFLPSGLPQPPAGRPSTFTIQLVFGSGSTPPTIPLAVYWNAVTYQYQVTLALLAASTGDQVFVAGYANNTLVFPSSNQSGTPVYNGGETDAFIAKLASADLALTNTTSSPVLIPTQVTTLTFNLSNSGPSTAANVVVTISIPTGLSVESCTARFACVVSGGTVSVTYPSLAASSSDNISLLVKANGTVIGTTVNFSGSVSSATVDGNPGNNVAVGGVSIGGATPPFVLNPSDTLTMATKPVGQTDQESVTLTPTSTVDIQLTLTPQGGTDPGVFSFPLGTATSFTTAAKQQIPIMFTPDGAGNESALLTVNAPKLAFSTTVMLSGTGTTPPPPPNLPTISQIVDGAGFLPVIAANAWVTVKGTNLATDTRTWSASDFVGGLLPKALDGTSVMINNQPAYVYYISSMQINVLAPRDSTLGNVQVQVTTPTGTVTGSVLKDQVAPGIFMNGPKYVVCTAGSSTVVGTNQNPVSPGQGITFYLSGMGDTNPPYPDGTAVNFYVTTTLTPTVQIGAATVTPTYSGMTGGSAGLYQLNLVVPSVPAGDQPVVVKIGTRQTQPGAFLAISQ